MDRIGQLSLIATDIGDILRFTSIGTCFPLLICIYYQEWDQFLPMAAVPVVLFILGSVLIRIPQPDREARLSLALFAVALIWMICAIVGALPFTLGAGMPYLDSVFEAMSGWTTTGLTLVPDVDVMSHTLLFWRSLMQWLGGLGIVAFTVTMAARSGLTPSRLYRSEGRSEAFMPSVVAQGLRMWEIYIILTIISVILIEFSGIPLWDAVNIVMAGLASGGFTVHSAGISYYNNPLLEMLIIPVMIAGALPFKIYYAAYRNKRVSFFHDEQAPLLFLLIGIGVLVIVTDLIWFNNLDTLTAVRQGLFMATAAATSTGFQVTSPSLWAPVTVLFLTILMFIGGSSGSTAGGIKLSRVALSYRGIVWWFKRMFVSAKVLVPFRYEGRNIQKNVAEPEVSKNMLVIFMYLVVIYIAAIVVMHLESGTWETSHVLFEIVSAICNNGISTGFVSPDMTPLSKIVFIMIMWVGRLEVVPVIVLFMGLIKGFER
ncbi:MAG: TrkH family potassium uptake protein [Euryarchaeota archaeon]|nr:TrkH family potassium uptake protein [Euryarchaeota archaeon]